MDRPEVSSADVVIVGAGIMGAALAYYLARAGVPALVLDRAGPAAEASGANAGMIGPSGGIPGKTLPLSLLSAELYDRAACELDEPIHFHRGGRLLLAHTPEDVAEREQFYRERQGLGIELHRLSGSEVREIEPLISPSVTFAVYAPADGHIDPFRATVAYLHTACRLGARFESLEVTGLAMERGAVRGVVTEGGTIRAERVVLAAGAWSGELARSAGVDVPVFPGRGQMMVTAPVEPLTPRVLRAVMIGLRQMDQGHLVIGSEVELVGFQKGVDVLTLARYADLAGDILPAARTLPLERCWSGLRPMTADTLPIIGGVPGVAGLDLLTGHGRSGMTYGPASALALADLIVHGTTDVPIEPLGLERFQA